MDRFRRVNEENNSYDLYAITTYIEKELQKLCDGEDVGGYDENFSFEGIVPISVKSDDVEITKLDVLCILRRGGFELIGIPKPNPELLNPELHDTVTYADDYREFDEMIPLQGSTDDIIRKADDVIAMFAKQIQVVKDLWEDMQERLIESDRLKGQLWKLMWDFEKKK